MSLIEVRDLHFRYNSEDRALKGVSLDIEKGEFVCILGHNGSGKSTLAKLLVGLLEPRKGTISIEGTILNEDSVDELRKKIGIVFQNPDNQFVGITVKDDIAFGLENRQVEREEMLKLIDEYSTKVNMHDFLDKNPESLSGGEKQRVAIATSMLDPRGVKEVMDVINNLKSKKTIISITHNLQEAIKADKVIVMNDGVIVLEGKPEEVFTHFDEIKNSKLDILDSMKILEMVDNSSINRKEEVKKALWELTYQK